jgi:hypothetical protein
MSGLEPSPPNPIDGGVVDEAAIEKGLRILAKAPLSLDR